MLCCEQEGFVPGHKSGEYSCKKMPGKFKGFHLVSAEATVYSNSFSHQLIIYCDRCNFQNVSIP